MRRVVSNGVALMTMEDVSRAIGRWRTTRAKRGPMPEELWTAAIGLVREHGLWRTSRELRVNYDYLKSRYSTAGDTSCGGAKGAFVELRAAATPVAATAGSPGTVIELSHSDARMVLRLAAGTSLDVGGLAAAFWSRA